MATMRPIVEDFFVVRGRIFSSLRNDKREFRKLQQFLDHEIARGIDPSAAARYCREIAILLREKRIDIPRTALEKTAATAYTNWTIDARRAA